MSFLVTRFSDLSIPEKATWQALAAKDLIPTYNAYLAANLERWRQFLAPSQAYPAAENGVLGDIDYWQATGGPAHVDLAADWYGIENNWGIIIFRSTSTGFTPSRSNAIAVVPHLLTSGTFYSDTGLPPATYYYKLRNFTTTGKLSTPSGQASATVT